MHHNKINATINHLITPLYFLGIWACQDEATVPRTMVKLFYTIYYITFPISLLCGAIVNRGDDGIVFLIEMCFITGVLAMKNVFLIWEKEQILEILYRSSNLIADIGNGKIKRYNLLSIFEKLTVVLIGVITLAGIVVTILYPYFTFERTLFFKIAFPLDWRNNQMAFLLVNLFIFTQTFYSIIPVIFSVLMWYSLLNCTLAYKVLQVRMQSIGTRVDIKELNNSHVEEQSFIRDLSLTTDYYQQIWKYESIEA